MKNEGCEGSGRIRYRDPGIYTDGTRRCFGCTHKKCPRKKHARKIAAIHKERWRKRKTKEPPDYKSYI